MSVAHRSNKPDCLWLSAQSLVQDGVVVPSAIILSHVAEIDRLAEAVPDAVPAAVVAGDPCYVRLIVGRANRNRYREVLGADERTTVVFVSSPWSRTPGLPPRRAGGEMITDQLPLWSPIQERNRSTRPTLTGHPAPARRTRRGRTPPPRQP
jgi:hypothetical protein